jgi:hypothetical protein
MAQGVTISHITPTLPIYDFAASEPGPTAIIQAGIHGDEIAGYHALEEWLEEGVTLARGRLIVIPRMNPSAVRSRTRCAPGGSDLNRAFPGDANSANTTDRLAAELMALYREIKPDIIATLHESQKRYHPEVPVSFGQTVVYGVQPAPPVVAHLVEKMNASLTTPYELWAPHYFPVATSSTEVIVEALGCVGLCLETWMGFPIERRVVMHRSLVNHILKYFQLT